MKPLAKYIAGLIGLLLATSLALAAKNNAETTIKFATVAPRNSTWMQIMSELDQELRKQTENRVGFKFYPGGVQGDEHDVIRKIKINQLHAGGFTGLGLGLIQPESRVLDLPFLFRDSDEVDAVTEGLFDEFAARFDQKGFVLLGWAEVGFVHFFSRAAIHNLDDLRQQKMWIWEGDPLAGAYFKELGLNPIPLALPDVLTSFQTGLINSAYASPYAASVLQWQSRVTSISDIAMANASGAVLVSKRIWKKLSPEDQLILRELGRRHLRRLTLESRRENQDALKAFAEAGIPVVASEPEAQTQFEALGRSVQDALSGELYSAQLLALVRQKLAEHRSKGDH